MNTLLSSCQAQPFKGTRLKDPLRGSIIDSKERGQVGQTSRHLSEGTNIRTWDRNPDISREATNIGPWDTNPDIYCQTHRSMQVQPFDEKYALTIAKKDRATDWDRNTEWDRNTQWDRNTEWDRNTVIKVHILSHKSFVCE